VLASQIRLARRSWVCLLSWLGVERVGRGMVGGLSRDEWVSSLAACMMCCGTKCDGNVYAAAAVPAGKGVFRSEAWSRRCIGRREMCVHLRCLPVLSVYRAISVGASRRRAEPVNTPGQCHRWGQHFMPSNPDAKDDCGESVQYMKKRTKQG
jgi:hypothetical protein